MDAPTAASVTAASGKTARHSLNGRLAVTISCVFRNERRPTRLVTTLYPYLQLTPEIGLGAAANRRINLLGSRNGDACRIVSHVISSVDELLNLGRVSTAGWGSPRSRSKASMTGLDVDDRQSVQEQAPPRRYTRRLSDKILIAFHQACDQDDIEVARCLLKSWKLWESVHHPVPIAASKRP